MKKSNNPNEIYFYQSEKKIDTKIQFVIKAVKNKLRVKNDNVNCLFSNLTALSFDDVYNNYYKYLNLNFEPVIIDNAEYSLTDKEKIWLEQNIIMDWIYFYTINNMPVKVKREDFKHPCVVDTMLQLADKKYGVDTGVALKLGAHILRYDFEEYKKIVKGRRIYYEK